MAINNLSKSASILKDLLERKLSKQAFVPQDASGSQAVPPGPGGAPADPSGGQGGMAPGGMPPDGQGGQPPGGQDPGGAPDQSVTVSLPDLMQLFQTIQQQGAAGGMPGQPGAMPGQPGQPGKGAKGNDLIIQKLDELNGNIGKLVAFMQGVKSVTEPGADTGPNPMEEMQQSQQGGDLGLSLGGGVPPEQGPQGAPTLPAGSVPQGAPQGDPAAAMAAQGGKQASVKEDRAKYLNQIMLNLLRK